MNCSLAKQDTLVANVISDILPVNEIPRSSISVTNLQQSVYKMPIIVPDGSLPSSSKTLQVFWNWRLVKTLAKQWKLSHQFCGNWQHFRVTSLYLSTSQTIVLGYSFIFPLLGLPSGHFPGRSFTRINYLNTKNDQAINHNSEANNFQSSVKGAFYIISSQCHCYQFICLFVGNQTLYIYTTWCTCKSAACVPADFRVTVKMVK
jgi:hypothetical protein